MGFLTKSTGQAVAQQATYETDFLDVLPNNTRVTGAVDAVEWRSPSDQQVADGDDVDHINVTWRVQGGQFDNRIIFQKLHVLSSDAKKRDNALDAYAALDTLLNDGLLLEMGEEPTDEELERVWMGKQADLVLGVWKNGKGADMKQGNFVKGIFAAGTGGTVAGEGRERRTRAGAAAAEPAAPPARTRTRAGAAAADPAPATRERRTRTR